MLTRLRGLFASRVFLGIADAGVSSAGNLLASVLVARSTDLPTFGVFATAMLVLTLLTGASRSLHGDVLLLTTSTSPPEQKGAAARLATTSVLRLSTATAAAGVVLAVVDSRLAAGWSDVPETLLAAALVLPLLCLQDQLRWVDYTRSRVDRGLVNNLLWTGTSSLALLVLTSVSRSPRPAQCLFVWGAGTLPGIAWGLRGGRVRLRAGALRRAAGWLRPQVGIARPLFLDFALTQATAQAATLVIAALTSATDLALIRKGQIWVAPLIVLTTGLLGPLQLVLNERARTRGPAATARLALLIGSAAALFCTLYGLVVLLVPTPLAEAVVGTGWSDARPFLVPLTVQAAAGVLGGCLGLALRTTGRVSLQVRWRLLIAPASVVLIAAAATRSGALAGAWAIALAGSVSCVAWLVLLRSRSTGNPVCSPDEVSSDPDMTSIQPIADTSPL